MLSTLKYAQAEMNRLKAEENKNADTKVDLVICFDRSEEDMKRLVGYQRFIEELDRIGGERTEVNIQEACSLSGLNRGSVIFGETGEDYHFSVRANKDQVQKMKYRESMREERN